MVKTSKTHRRAVANEARSEKITAILNRRDVADGSIVSYEELLRVEGTWSQPDTHKVWNVCDIFREIAHNKNFGHYVMINNQVLYICGCVYCQEMMGQTHRWNVSTTPSSFFDHLWSKKYLTPKYLSDRVKKY